MGEIQTDVVIERWLDQGVQAAVSLHDLLEAAEAAVRELESYDPPSARDESHSIGFAVHTLRAAIAKARP